MFKAQLELLLPKVNWKESFKYFIILFQLYINLPTPDMCMFHAWFEMKFWVNSVQVSQIEATSISAICQDSPHKISHRHGATRGNVTDLYDLHVAAERGDHVVDVPSKGSLFAHYSAIIYFLPKSFGSYHLFSVPHIQCKCLLILWDVIFRHYHNSSISLKGIYCSGKGDKNYRELSD